MKEGLKFYDLKCLECRRKVMIIREGTRNNVKANLLLCYECQLIKMLNGEVENMKEQTNMSLYVTKKQFYKEMLILWGGYFWGCFYV